MKDLRKATAKRLAKFDEEIKNIFNVAVKMKSLRFLFLVILAVGIVIGTVSGELPDAEPAFEQRYCSGTVRKLTDREFLDALIRRAWRKRLLRFVVVVVLLLIVGNVVGIDTGEIASAFSVCASQKVTVKGFQVTEDNRGIAIAYPVNTKCVLSKNHRYYDQMIDVEMVKLSFFRDFEGRKLLTQEEIGKLFGISRQMINRRVRLVDETGDLVPLVKREYDKSVLTEKVLKRIAEIIAEDWWKSDEEIAAQILREGLTEKICSGSVHHALSMMDVRFLRKSIRERIKKGNLPPEIGQAYLIRRLFEMIEALVEKKQLQQEYIDLKSLAEKIEEKQNETSQRGKYNRDVEQKRVRTEQNRKRRRNILRMAIDKRWNMYKEREDVCPDCLRPAVELRQKRNRRYKNGGCQEEKTKAEQYECKNDQCSTKTFTKLPNQLEPSAQSDFFRKRQAFGLVFEVRGSLRRSADYITFVNGAGGPAWTTVLNWIRKAGREVVALETLFPIRWSGTLGIDEKWVKLFNKWIYIYKAIDMKTGFPILEMVFPSCNKDNAKAVLLEIKARGYLPKIIVTDLIRDYDKAVEDLFPNAKHQRCLFHAEKAAHELIRKYLGEDWHKKTKEQIWVLLRALFSAKTLVEVESELARFLWAREFFPDEAQPIFNLIERIAEDIKNPKKNSEIPTTNNATESAIKEFDILYSTKFGYSSIVALQEFLNGYNVYQRFHKYASGPFKGRCPLEITGYDIGNLTWDFYLLAA